MTNEYFTEAVVLDKEPSGEFDSIAHLYTQELGRVSASVTSARKILSKLNSHLEPLNLVQVRLVEKNRFHVADVLKTGVLDFKYLGALKLIKSITPEVQPDPELWQLIKTDLNEKDILRILGFDSQFAACLDCGLKRDLRFSINDLSYFCVGCYDRLS